MWINMSSADGTATELRPVAMATGAVSGGMGGTGSHLAATPTCMGVWNCETKWPWWISTAPCGLTRVSGANTTAETGTASHKHGAKPGTVPPSPTARCSASDTQRWRWVALNQSGGAQSLSAAMGLQWVPQHYNSAHACWGRYVAALTSCDCALAVLTYELDFTQKMSNGDV